MNREHAEHAAERARRLLRRLDIEEVLEDLGVEISHRNGADLYCYCPDPEHRDSNPSFHVCAEEIVDERGRNRLGWFSCWSHPGGGFYGADFLDLIARVREGIYDRFATRDERDRAASWLRMEYLRRPHQPSPDVYEALRKHREALEPPPSAELIFPPSKPVGKAQPAFARYLASRGISSARAAELGVLAVRAPGERLRSAITRTLPGVLFPISDGGRVVNWYIRGISKRLSNKDKGRYCPGVPLGLAGVTWGDGEPDLRQPVIFCEGIFDAERVGALLARGKLPRANVRAVLGGKLTEPQAKRFRSAPLVLCLADGDAGGEAFGESIRKRLQAFTRVEVRMMPPGTDPADAPEQAILEALKDGLGRRGKQLAEAS